MSYHNSSSSSYNTSSTSQRQAAAVPSEILALNDEEITENVRLSSEIISNISSFEIDTTDMPTGVQSRFFNIKGEIGAKFFMVITLANSSKFYNFVEEAFEDGHSSASNLIITLSKNHHRGTVNFPSGGGDFVFKVIALENTTIFNSKKVAITKSIFKAGGNVTVTFSPFSGVANAYDAFTTFTCVGYDQAVTSEFELNLTNTENESNGFGLTTVSKDSASEITEDQFFYSVTDTVSGATSSLDTVIVNDLTGIIVGTEIHGVSSGSLAGTPSVISIDTITKKLTLSAAQSFADGITLTFRSYGQENIENAAGIVFSIFRFPIFTQGSFTEFKTRLDHSGGATAITVDGTYGIPAGVEIAGRGIPKGTTISQVNQADTDATGNGLITVSNTLKLVVGEKLISNSFTTAKIKGAATVSTFPTANTNIFLDLDKIITVGEAT